MPVWMRDDVVWPIQTFVSEAIHDHPAGAVNFR